eukprot:2564137-Prymnesium_polylepis.1
MQDRGCGDSASAGWGGRSACVGSRIRKLRGALCETEIGVSSTNRKKSRGRRVGVAWCPGRERLSTLVLGPRRASSVVSPTVHIASKQQRKLQCPDPTATLIRALITDVTTMRADPAGAMSRVRCLSIDHRKILARKVTESNYLRKRLQRLRHNVDVPEALAG